MPTLPQFPLRALRGLTCVVLHACHAGGSHSTPPTAFEVVVDADSGPQYRWNAPAALVVRVTPLESPTALVWGVMDTAAGVIAPITHGSTPRGTVSVVRPTVALQPNALYRVTVTLADGRVGHQQFRTPPVLRERSSSSRSP